MRGKIRPLSKKNDFALMKKEGKFLSKNGFFLIYRKSPFLYYRVAFAFSRWTGNAVQRNRFKRWGRDFLTKSLCPTPVKGKENNKSLKLKSFNYGGWDILMGFKKKEKGFYTCLSYADFCQGWVKVFSKTPFAGQWLRSASKTQKKNEKPIT